MVDGVVEVEGVEVEEVQEDEREEQVYGPHFPLKFP